MRANTGCGRASRYLTVFLNGKEVDDAIEASEEEGYVWAVYRNAKGTVVPAIMAELGTTIHDDVQVIKLTGEVKIKIDVRETDPRDDYTAREVRDECAKHFHPIRVTKIIQ